MGQQKTDIGLHPYAYRGYELDSVRVCLRQRLPLVGHNSFRSQTTFSQGSPKTIGNTDIYFIIYNSSKNSGMKKIMVLGHHNI